MWFLFLAFVISVSGEVDLPWNRWSWSMPQVPIQHFFRRHDDMPVKSNQFHCDCPPYKECKVEYKINEGSADFLALRGVIKGEELKSYRRLIEDAKSQEIFEEKPSPAKHKSRRDTRAGSQPEEEDCCCEPRNVLFPAFITDQKFDETVGRFKNQV